MRYFLRALKYFFKILIVFAAVIAVVYYISPQYRAGDIPGMFKEGWLSILYIVGIFIVFSGIYPLVAYGKRKLEIPSGNVKDRIGNAMNARDYTLMREEEDRLVYSHSKIGRLLHSDFDAVTFTIKEDGVEIEGFKKEIVRIYL